MPMFYIHVFNGHGPQIDEVGREFASARIAVGEAAKTIGELIRDDLSEDTIDRALRIVVEDAQRRQVAELSATMALAIDNLG